MLLAEIKQKGRSGRPAWSPDGRFLASASTSGEVVLWDLEASSVIRRFESNSQLSSLAWSPDSQFLAAASMSTIVLLDAQTGTRVATLRGHKEEVTDVAWSPIGLASSSLDGTVRVWDSRKRDLIATFGPVTEDGKPEVQLSVAWSPDGTKLVSSSWHLCIWDLETGALRKGGRAVGFYDSAWYPADAPSLIAAGDAESDITLFSYPTAKTRLRLEGHTGPVHSVSFSFDNGMLASLGNELFVWECKNWKPILIHRPLETSEQACARFHPHQFLLATAGANLIQVWKLSPGLLSGKRSLTVPTAVQHTTAKIVLVGDAGVGKTGLGWRLAHGQFKEHSSTHGQQFWVIDALRAQRSDGTECEAILWDLAGQPDYRLTHALFLDDADLALILFDPTDSRDPLHGVEFWLKQLSTCGQAELQQDVRSATDRTLVCPVTLVGARADRGDARLTSDELAAFCQAHEIEGGYIATSAKEGRGLPELIKKMTELVPWDRKTPSVTTTTFKHIKDYVLTLKEGGRQRNILVKPQDLRRRLEKTNRRRKFTNGEMMAAVGHLSNYGYVRILRTSKAEERILLAPELLNNLAASFVLEARRNPKGLGSLEEKRLLAGGYPFRELEGLSVDDREVLLDAVALLFLEHNVCFRETDPLRGLSYLVFPELINLKKPGPGDEESVEDDVSYSAVGAVENVYASLVVLLGYTETFTRTDQWRNHARYEVGDGLICGFRKESEHDGELELVLYFGRNVGQPVRALFKGLFESFLSRRKLTVHRYEPVVCEAGHRLNRAVVREQLRSGRDSAYCPECGNKTLLPRADAPIQLTQDVQGKVDEEQRLVVQRSRFEQAIFKILSYVESRKLPRPDCFISYAWGDSEQERWVEKNLATDMQKAGISVILDRWENSRAGASVPRFVERIEKCSQIIVVGTPGYRTKYENTEKGTGSIVAAEFDVISNRLLGTEAQKQSVLPILLQGDKTNSFPPLLHSRVFADFRDKAEYFVTLFDLVLNLYGISTTEAGVADLRNSLLDTASPASPRF